MRMLPTARHAVAFVLLASQPPAVLLWVAIHPFAAFWRKRGPALTYGILGIPVAGYMVLAWLFRERLLGRDLGTSLPAMALAAGFVVAGSLLNRQRRKLLDFGTLSGIPELSGKRYPGKLLTEGIYGRIRHPRYVEVQSFVFAYALFANYSGAYLVAFLNLPVMLAVVVLEERELRQRFGTDYDEYRRRVPRFIPRRRRHGAG